MTIMSWVLAVICLLMAQNSYFRQTVGLTWRHLRPYSYGLILDSSQQNYGYQVQRFYISCVGSPYDGVPGNILTFSKYIFEHVLWEILIQVQMDNVTLITNMSDVSFYRRNSYSKANMSWYMLSVPMDEDHAGLYKCAWRNASKHYLRDETGYEIWRRKKLMWWYDLGETTEYPSVPNSTAPGTVYRVKPRYIVRKHYNPPTITLVIRSGGLLRPDNDYVPDFYKNITETVLNNTHSIITTELQFTVPYPKRNYHITAANDEYKKWDMEVVWRWEAVDFERYPRRRQATVAKNRIIAWELECAHGCSLCYGLRPRCHRCSSDYTLLHADCYWNWCQPNPCQNNATCRSTQLSFVCECANGYGGKLCDQPCSQHCIRCYNEHHCKKCHTGYYVRGFVCVIDVCPVDYCLNQGVCLVWENPNYDDCPPEKYGPRCETLDEVNPPLVTCFKQRICLFMPNAHFCDCPPGKFGPRCEKLDEIGPPVYTCFKQDTCLVLPNWHYCDCPPGKFGPRCEKQCLPNCQSCDEDRSKCEACERKYGLGGVTRDVCLPCPAHCESCSENNNTQCDWGHCEPGYVNDPLTNTCQQCTDRNCLDCSIDVNRCMPTKCRFSYRLNATSGICEPCRDPLCIKCDNDKDSCDDEGCPKGYILNNASKNCEDCEAHCDSCAPGNVHCPPHSQCPIGFTTREPCRRCVLNCLQCTDVSACDYRMCKPGYGIGNEHRQCFACPANCVRCDFDYRKCEHEGCELNYGLNTDTDQCERCSINSCLRCDDNRSACDSGQCPHGFRYDSTMRDCIECEMRHCLSCEQAVDRCDPGKCTIGYGYRVTHHSCERCVSNCLSCDDDLRHCDANMCSAGYYFIASDGYCSACPAHCTRCENSTGCDPGHCEDGYGLDQAGWCVPCPDHCRRCDIDVTRCSVGNCMPGYGIDASGEVCIVYTIIFVTEDDIW